MTSIDDLFQRLERLNDIGAALSSERHLPGLLEKILVAAKEITRADGGTLYLKSSDEHSLHFEIVRTDSLGIAYGGPNGTPRSRQFGDLPLYLPDGQPNHRMVACHAALSGFSVNIADAYAAEGYDFSGTRAFDQSTGYRSRSFLTVPMQDHEGKLIGVLQLINAIDPATGKTTFFSPADQRLAESLASQAAIAINNRRLIAQLEQLFEAFIALINLAIDEKSPYTGTHCQQVPALVMMLADAADAATEGPLADFHMTEAERHELRIAALLHDCGKIATPVHVVDKATKLQTIHDRIHLVDVRFEVLKRDAEIRMWQAIAAGEARPAAEEACREFCDRCDVDRQFLRRINLGSERMSDEDATELQAIAQRYTWRDPEAATVPLLTQDELDNLAVRSGTLTRQEREIINQHIVTTIHMLEQLPWPPHLSHVTEYAGGHHERMDGKGYPKGLTREQLSWPARMLGVADIFEALTAGDRPYKHGMPFDEAMQVMARFARDGHIDPVLFELLVKTDIGRRYVQAKEAQANCP